jgi:hypothetical protein
MPRCASAGTPEGITRVAPLLSAAALTVPCATWGRHTRSAAPPTGSWGAFSAAPHAQVAGRAVDLSRHDRCPIVLSRPSRAARAYGARSGSPWRRCRFSPGPVLRQSATWLRKAGCTFGNALDDMQRPRKWSRPAHRSRRRARRTRSDPRAPVPGPKGIGDRSPAGRGRPHRPGVVRDTGRPALAIAVRRAPSGSETIPPSAPPRHSGAAGVPGSPIPPAFDTTLFAPEGRVGYRSLHGDEPEYQLVAAVDFPHVPRPRPPWPGSRPPFHTVSIPPGSSVRAIAPAMRLRPKAASAPSVLLHVTPARWENAKRFVPPGLRLEGRGRQWLAGRAGGRSCFAVQRDKQARVRRSGVRHNQRRGRLTGAVAVVISFPAHQQGPVSIPVPRPASGPLAADCQIAPDGR